MLFFFCYLKILNSLQNTKKSFRFSVFFVSFVDDYSAKEAREKRYFRNFKYNDNNRCLINE